MVYETGILLRYFLKIVVKKSGNFTIVRAIPNN